MASLCGFGALPPFPRYLVKARSHAVLSESGPAEARELSHALHQKDIDGGKPNRNHRRKPINYRINDDEVFVIYSLCRSNLLVSLLSTLLHTNL